MPDPTYDYLDYDGLALYDEKIKQLIDGKVDKDGAKVLSTNDYTTAEIDELWAEREESELTKKLLEENNLPNLARIFTERRYVKEDNVAISRAYLNLLKEHGFLNQ